MKLCRYPLPALVAIALVCPALVCPALVCPALAQPAQQNGPPAPETADKLAATIAPFLDPQTVAVVHVDLARFDLTALLDVALPEGARRRNDDGRAEPADTRQRLHRGVEALREGGVRDLFVVLSLADLPRSGPFVVVPNAKKDAVCAAIDQLRGAAQGRVCEERDGIVFYGHAATSQRLSEQRAVARLPVEPALAAVAESGLKLVVPVSDGHRRVLREMAPQLPPELGGVRGDDLAAVQWAAVGVETMPQVRLRTIVQTNDAQAAAALKELVGTGLAMFREMPPVREAVPGIEDLVDILTPEVEGERLITSIAGEEQLAKVRRALSRPLQQARAQQARAARMNDLKQFGLAMHNFHDVYKSFPPSARYDGEKPVLSWRVYVLPFLDQKELYEQFRLDEPWDSEHNKTLIEKMPPVFAGSDPELRRQGKTTVLAPLGEGTIFSGERGVAIREITDGTSNTILLVSVPREQAVIWTKPDDFEVDFEKPLAGLVGEGDEGFLALRADGSVQFISRKVDAETLRRLLIRNDGQPVGDVP